MLIKNLRLIKKKNYFKIFNKRVTNKLNNALLSFFISNLKKKKRFKARYERLLRKMYNRFKKNRLKVRKSYQFVFLSKRVIVKHRLINSSYIVYIKQNRLAFINQKKKLLNFFKSGDKALPFYKPASILLNYYRNKLVSLGKRFDTIKDLNINSNVSFNSFYKNTANVLDTLNNKKDKLFLQKKELKDKLEVFRRKDKVTIFIRSGIDTFLKLRLLNEKKKIFQYRLRKRILRVRLPFVSKVSFNKLRIKSRIRYFHQLKTFVKINLLHKVKDLIKFSYNSRINFTKKINGQNSRLFFLLKFYYRRLAFLNRFKISHKNLSTKSSFYVNVYQKTFLYTYKERVLKKDKHFRIKKKRIRRKFIKNYSKYDFIKVRILKQKLSKLQVLYSKLISSRKKKERKRIIAKTSKSLLKLKYTYSFYLNKRSYVYKEYFKVIQLQNRCLRKYKDIKTIKTLLLKKRDTYVPNVLLNVEKINIKYTKLSKLSFLYFSRLRSLKKIKHYLLKLFKKFTKFLFYVKKKYQSKLKSFSKFKSQILILSRTIKYLRKKYRRYFASNKYRYYFFKKRIRRPRYFSLVRFFKGITGKVPKDLSFLYSFYSSNISGLDMNLVNRKIISDYSLTYSQYIYLHRILFRNFLSKDFLKTTLNNNSKKRFMLVSSLEYLKMLKLNKKKKTIILSKKIKNKNLLPNLRIITSNKKNIIKKYKFDPIFYALLLKKHKYRKKMYKRQPWFLRRVRRNFIYKKPVKKVYIPKYISKKQKKQPPFTYFSFYKYLQEGAIDLKRLPYFIFNFNRIYAKFKANFIKRYRFNNKCYKARIDKQKKLAPYVKQDYSSFYSQVKTPYLYGTLHFKFNRNNLFGCLTNKKNRIIYYTSSGKCGFKGPKRSTPYAREKVAYALASKALLLNYKVVDLDIKLAPKRKYFEIFKGLGDNNIAIRLVHAFRGLAHGYVRAKKRRRL